MAYTPKYKRLEKQAPAKTDQSNTSPVSTQKFYCCRCGNSYSRQRGYFTVSHSPMYRGTGFLPICNNCIDEMFDYYAEKLGNRRAALKRMCMKLDLYWSEGVANSVERSAGIKSWVRTYVQKVNLLAFVDKCYDDTIREEEMMGSYIAPGSGRTVSSNPAGTTSGGDSDDTVSNEVITRWGIGYTPEMYHTLEARRAYWISQYPEGHVLDVGEEVLIQQICGMEIDITRDRANGKPVDKSVNTLNTLLGSAGLKPGQKNEDEDSELDNMPFGVGIRKWENTRPIPEPDPSLQDVDGIVRYISIWFLGHLCKMLGIKNSYCKLYEEEMERLRVRAPEFEDEEDDEALFNNIFEGGNNE